MRKVPNANAIGNLMYVMYHGKHQLCYWNSQWIPK